MGLLGHVLELRGGKSYETLVTERILLPLGMRDTYITPPGMSLPREATGHNVDLEAVPPWRLQHSVYQAAGGWRSSLRDLLALATAAMEQPATPVGRALALAMTAVRPAGSPADSNGLGWAIRTRNGKRIVWHNGGTDGFSSMLAIDLDDVRAAAVLINSAGDADVIAWHLVDPRTTLAAPVARAHIELPVPTLSRYAGEYVHLSGSRSRVYLDGSRLYFEPAGVPRMRLYAESEVRFFLRSGRDVEFALDSAGTVTEIVIRRGERVFRAKRVAP
jgi:CubicO group peptidase (beta-lactamase class C family)